MPELLEEAIRICTVPAPTFAESRRAELVAELFAVAGGRPVIDEVGNVLCELGPQSGEAVVLAAHLDTVFGPEVALDVVREAGRVRAPGLGDNSLAVAALLELTRRLREQPPARRLLLAATVGEEGLGDLRGAKHLVATVPCAAFVAVEGSDLDALITGAVGSTRLRVTFRGRGGHSWQDRGAPSAVHELIERAAGFLASPAPSGLARNIGTLSGGTTINTIAAEATLALDLRSLSETDLAAAAAAATRHFEAAPAGLSAEVEVIGRRPGGSMPADHPLVEAARRARADAGLEPAHEEASSTDANAALGAGIPAITVGITTGGNAHRLDEYIDIEPIEAGMRALELLARELAGG